MMTCKRRRSRSKRSRKMRELGGSGMALSVAPPAAEINPEVLDLLFLGPVSAVFVRPGSPPYCYLVRGVGSNVVWPRRCMWHYCAL